MQVQNASVLIPTTGLVSGAAIRAAPKLRLIAQPATGHNNIDVDTASSSGIPVCTAPGTAASSCLPNSSQYSCGLLQPYACTYMSSIVSW
jgi:lactate dehydrogenase-like 2-hydroxyacid dehydrogenase